MTERKTPDWERIEADYRAGVLSLREIAAGQGISHVAVKKRATKEGWERDLHAKIRAKAEALVNKAAVTSEVTAQAKVTERQVIEANATRIAQVRGEHRSDIARARALALKLMAELEAHSIEPELLAEFGEIMRKPDAKGIDKLNDLYHKVISLPSRVDSVKKLAETLKHLIGLEREAYGLTVTPGPEGDDGAKSLDDFYGAIAAKS